MQFVWRLNPWWEERTWEKKDKHLREFEYMPIKWIPKWISKLSMKPFSLNFIIGPRRVGKTTGIKLLLRELMKSANPFQILYLDLELITDLKELRDAFLYYFRLRKERGVRKSFIFLDEVSRLYEWHRIVKGFIDLGEFKRDVLVISGSCSINLLKHAESFAGRRGHGKDVFVLPLSFKEFVEVSKVNPLREDMLKTAFKDYTVVGGFPQSINRLTRGEELIKAFEVEITRYDLSVEIAKQILSTIFELAPSAVSFNAIASKIGKSNKTVESYLETFQDLFIAKIVYWKDRKHVNFRKEKKIFLRDPFLARSFAAWCNKDIRKDFLYEWIVQEHLFRKFGEIYYFRNGYEIDCIAGKELIEVKAGKSHRKYPKNVRVVDENLLPKFLFQLSV
ncbi:ATP-binding protein [Candidatus Woesearchaeota archaeon]|nr:MAG: ATP-binding protein [Candidatus Woesearchaeota archaeon]